MTRMSYHQSEREKQTIAKPTNLWLSLLCKDLGAVVGDQYSVLKLCA